MSHPNSSHFASHAHDQISNYPTLSSENCPNAVFTMLSPKDHLGPCLTRPIGTCVVTGTIFTAVDTLIGGRPISFRLWGLYSGGLYAYNVIQCPMEIIHGRQSSLHNVASGGLLGYIGVSRGMISVPFVNPYFLYGARNPGLIGAVVYGGISGLLATLGGKPM